MLSSSLTELRAEVATICQDAGLTAYDHVPERYVPPVAVITYGSPMIEQGDAFCVSLVRLDVTIVAAKGTNDKATDAFDTQLTSAILALVDSNWTVERVDEPARVTVNNAEHLGTTLTVSTQVTLVKEEA